MKTSIINSIMEEKIIVIARKVATENLIATAEALYAGGIRLIEVTFDQSGEFSSQVTADQIKLLNSHFDGNMLVGAGTVMTAEQTKIAYDSGAKYIISPNVDKNVIETTTNLGMVSIPGALTPTEISLAHSYGADFVKMFPAGELGINYLKAVLAPLNHIKTLAVGGINENNLKDFLSIGIKGVGVGSNIIKNDLIMQGNFKEITELALKYRECF